MKDDKPTNEKARWHISREVPLSLVYLLIAQLVGALFVGLTLGKNVQNSVTDHEKRLTMIESQKMSERITSLEQQMQDARRLMEKIDGKVDRLLERKSI